VTSRRDTFDVVVVGAGPAGSATARRLALGGCHVALVERTRFDAARIGESLAPNVQPLLRDLGVWENFLAVSPLPSLGTRSVWGGDAELRTHSHLMSPWGCGWHVDRLAFDRMLAEAARTAGAVLLCGTTLVRCDVATDGWVLTLVERNDDRTKQPRFCLRAKVVIDATGRAAHLAPWVGAKRLLFDHLVGVATQFNMIQTAHEGYVMVEATTDGWWYSAPMPDDRMMIMLMTDGDLCRRANLGSAPMWFGRLNATRPTRERMARGTHSWGPRVFSAVSQRLRRPADRAPWLAVGDAALAVDPISGSGVVRALRSACTAAEAALAKLAAQTPNAIEAYEANIDLECTKYLHERALYYAIEQRWQRSDFWQRRATAATNVTLRGS